MTTRPRLLPPKRPPRMPDPAVSVARPVVASKVAVVTRGTSRTPSRSRTKSAWMSCVVSVAPPAAPRPRMSLLAPPPCSTRAATADASVWLPVAASVVLARSLVLPPALAPLQLLTPTRLGKFVSNSLTLSLLTLVRLLADAGDNPTSPPSTAASPAMSKVTPDTGSGEKKD